MNSRILNDSAMKIIDSYLRGMDNGKVILHKMGDKVKIIVEYFEEKHIIYIENEK